MENGTIRIPLFHVDTVINNQGFVKGVDINPSTEDGDWAGSGLYFWNNEGNARYWLRDKKRKNPEKDFNVVKAYLCVKEDKILDLTEPTSIKDFEDNINTFQRLGLLDMRLGNKHKGAVINALAKVLEKFPTKKQFTVVKVIGYYPRIKPTIYFKEEKTILSRNQMPYVTIKAKEIYAVRDQSLLKDRLVLKEAEL